MMQVEVHLSVTLAVIDWVAVVSGDAAHVHLGIQVVVMLFVPCSGCRESYRQEPRT
jgi:hypothetical protein